MRASLCVVLALGLCTPVCGEMARPVAPRGFLPPVSTMRNAGVIFSGTVLKIEHLTQAGFPGTTQITFKVENGIRGARQGQNLTIREWAGLWTSGERYRNSERVLLFLYPQSKLGLTSPVGGAIGRYEVDREGRVLANRAGPAAKPIRVRDFTSAMRRAAQER